jgi:hypothetical protein
LPTLPTEADTWPVNADAPDPLVQRPLFVPIDDEPNED